MKAPFQLPLPLPDHPYNVADAAAWLGYDPATVRRLIHHKDPTQRLAATKVGGQWRITREALLSLIEREVAP